MYDETERTVSLKNLDNFGINPAAVNMLVQDYKKHCMPNPITLCISCGASPIVRLSDASDEVEIYLRTPGFVGRAGKGDASRISKFARRMVAKSYADYVSPRLLSFVFDGVEVAVKTKGEDEGKNIARVLFNPTK